MARVNGPAMSLDASGSLAGTIVYSKWKGRNYVRQHVVPANPRKPGQVGVRAMFKFLTQIWDGLLGPYKATWDHRADDMVVSPFNAFVSYNQRRWRNFETPSKQDPAAEVSTPPDPQTGVATPGVRSMSLAITHGAEFADWGCAIFRSLTSSFPLTWDKCIAVVEADVAADSTYVDTPLEPGTYYYNSIGFTSDGVKGADGVEFEGTIT